jgi:hypothetical protein
VATPQQFIDGIEAFTQGVDSGIAPVLLKRSQCAWATNATFRGSFIKPRPAFLKVALTLHDPTIDLTKLFQGAGYYLSDEGIGSVMAQIGGRQLQFIPDTDGNATVYDRTPLSQKSSIVVTTTKQALTTPGAVVLTNISDSSGATYTAGTNIVSGAKVLATSLNSVSATNLNPRPITSTININGGLTITESGPASSLEFGYNGQSIHIITSNPLGLDMSNEAIFNGNVVYTYYGQVYFGNNGSTPLLWDVIGVSGNNVTLGYATGNPILPSLVIPAGTPIQQAGTSSTVVLGTNADPFTVPAVGASVNVTLNQPNTLLLGQIVTPGNGLYFVSSFIYGTTQYVDQTTVTVTPVAGTIYDPNPAGLRQAWCWQSENYFIFNNGVNKPVIFDNFYSFRSSTPIFNGTVTAPFVIPQIGTTVALTLDSDYMDEIGRYIQVTPYGLFPFLMQVVAIDGNQIVATNISGGSAAGQTVPANAQVESIYNPNYGGEVSAPFTMPADNTTAVTFPVTPNFNGAVGDTIIVTDGTGSFTTYTMVVTAIAGNQITATLSSGVFNAKISLGFSVISQKTQPQQLPVGRMGAYVQGRNWISDPSGTGFIVTDLVGSSSGTEQFNYRDAVLNWSQNTATFPIPGGFGHIQGIIALAALDASLGQGPLQILCDNGLFTCSAPTDATTWASLTTPILAPSVLGMGGVGQNAMAIANADLLFKSGDGTLRDLQMARDDFIKWGRLPISKEVARALANENPGLFPFVSAATADNRFLIGCQPAKSPLGVYCQGLVSLDFDITSSLQGKLPSVYDGAWTGLNILQLVGGMFNGMQRTFAFVANTTSGTIELWELTLGGLADGDGTQPITWSFESSVMFHELKGKGPFEFCSLQDGEIYISDLVGKATVQSWYRPDYDSCWHKWHNFEICADNLAPAGQPQYRTRLGLGKPPTEDGDNPVGRPPNFGRFFQMRFEITGSLAFMGALFMATPEPESRFARVAGEDEGESML